MVREDQYLSIGTKTKFIPTLVAKIQGKRGCTQEIPQVDIDES